MDVKGVYKTKSLTDDSRVGEIHDFKTHSATKTLCGIDILSRVWFFTYEEPTCKKCKEEANR